MSSLIIELSVILILSLVNGIFSMAELAVMSANRGRLAARANKEKGAAFALYLVENSAQFLATVQIGITLVGIMAGVVGGATLAADLSLILQGLHIQVRVADPLAFVTVVGAIAYLTLILGELVPKQIALSHPETVAILVARPLTILSRICRPLVWILETSGQLVIKGLPFSVGQRNEVSMDDIHHLISEGEKEGEIRRSEKDMAIRMFKLEDRPISAFMTVRKDLVWLDVQTPLTEMWELAVRIPHSVFPVAEGTLDNVLGIISIKDLWVVITSNGKISIHDVLNPALRVPSSQDALGVLEKFKKERRKVAFVIDHYGGLAGMITTHDLLEAIVGDLADYEGEERSIVPRSDGSALVDAVLDAHELFLYFKQKQPDHPTSHEYHSVGGILFKEFGRVPRVGEVLHWGGLKFEVVDLDGNRIDKVLVSKLAEVDRSPVPLT